MIGKQLKMELDKAHLRKRGANDVACGICVYHDTIIVNPSDENSDRYLICKYHNFHFPINTFAFGYVCDNYKHDGSLEVFRSIK